MGNCAQFGAVSEDRLPREKFRRERERAAVLSGRELDRGRRATMWVSPHYPHPPPKRRELRCRTELGSVYCVVSK